MCVVFLGILPRIVHHFGNILSLDSVTPMTNQYIWISVCFFGYDICINATYKYKHLTSSLCLLKNSCLSTSLYYFIINCLAFIILYFMANALYWFLKLAYVHWIYYLWILSQDNKEGKIKYLLLEGSVGSKWGGEPCSRI